MPTRLTLQLAALSLLPLSGLPAQEAPTQSAAAAEVVAKAREDLRSNSKERQIAAVQALALVVSEAAQADELGVTRALGNALSSEHDEVVVATVAALDKSPDRAAAMQLVVKHLDKLTTALLKTRQPKWPETNGLGITIPVLPPFLPPSPTAKQRRAYKKQMAAFKRRLKEQEKKETRDRRVRQTAMRDNRKLMTAASNVSAFVGKLGQLRDDAVVDAQIRALDVTLRQEASHAGPIAEALLASRRRDAVEKCVAIVIQNKFVEAGARKDRDRFLQNNIEQRAKNKTADKDDTVTDAFSPFATRTMTSRVRELLQQFGKKHGVEFKHTDISAAEMRTIMAYDKKARDAALQRMQDDRKAAWQAWLKEISPHLCDSVGIERE